MSDVRGPGNAGLGPVPSATESFALGAQAVATAMPHTTARISRLAICYSDFRYSIRSAFCRAVSCSPFNLT